jgi:hypothetical protein
MAHPVTRPRAGTGRRLVVLLLLAIMFASSLTLWIGIPVLGMWAFSHVTDTPSTHLLLAVVTIPAAMLAFAPFLFWVNSLYLRVTGTVTDEDEDDEDRRRVRGPLEPILVASLVVAALGLVAWILFFAAESPQLQVI